MPPPVRTTFRPATLALTALLTTSLLLPACGASGPSGEAVVRDSAGIRIVENPPLDGKWKVEPGPPSGASILLEPEPSVSIGSLDGPPEYTFQSVRDAARLPDGRIVVADGAELKYYDAAGRHLATAGGEGEGPGEFSFLNAVVACGGEVVAGDMRQQYLSIFDRDGAFVETRPVQSSGNPVFAMILEACDEATGLPLLRAPSPFNPAAPAGMRVDSIAILRAGAGGAGADTVAAIPVPVRTGGMSGPFDPVTRYAFDGASIHVIETSGMEVRTYGADGLRRIARVPHEPRPVSADDQARAIQSMLDRMPATFVEQLRPELEAAPVPDFMPAVRSIAADAAGRVWIQPFSVPWEDPSTTWVVLDADGATLGTAELPAGFRPLEIGEDWVLGVWEDELDVPYVRLYQFGP